MSAQIKDSVPDEIRVSHAWISTEPVDEGLRDGGGNTHAHPMSRLDGCPECVLNTELPKSTIPTDNGHRAAYLCNDCGHAWTTDWTD